MNILIFIRDNLEESLQVIQKKLRLETADTDEVWDDLRDILDKLGELLNQELPSLQYQSGTTRLDKWIKTKRDDEWKQMRKDVHDMRMHLHVSMDKLTTDLEDLKFKLRALAVEVRRK